MKNKIFTILTLLLLLNDQVYGKIILPAYISDNMVLQQESKNKIKGKAKGNTRITMFTSWDNTTYKTKSDASGNFSFEITTPSYGGPYQIKFSDGEELTVNNVCIGDVWICSGQSNMEMPVKGYRGQPVNNSQEAIVSANGNRLLRLFSVKKEYSTSAKDDVTGHWSKADPKGVADFSATGYFFGDLIEKKLNIPVGLIHASWGASKIEAWMDKETISQFNEFDLSVLNNTEFGYPNGTPTLLYNAMIHPFKGLSVKGIVWYQGESNSTQPELYERLFKAWIGQWRTFFGNPSLPCYYVQIAPYRSSDKDAIGLPIFRESQLKCMQEIPNIGMVFTTDIGSEKFIHAPEKKKVGERLAYWALAKTYSIEGIDFCGPIFKDYKRKDNIVELRFSYAENGLNPENENIYGFEIAGSDGVYKEAKAEIINGSAVVKVWNDEVLNPVEVRYCFRNYKEGNLTNNVGLPATSFRVTIK